MGERDTDRLDAILDEHAGLFLQDLTAGDPEFPRLFAAIDALSREEVTELLFRAIERDPEKLRLWAEAMQSPRREG